MEDIPQKNRLCGSKRDSGSLCVSGPDKVRFCLQDLLFRPDSCFKAKSLSSSSHLTGFRLLLYLHTYAILRGKMIIYK